MKQTRSKFKYARRVCRPKGNKNSKISDKNAEAIYVQRNDRAFWREIICVMKLTLKLK